MAESSTELGASIISSMSKAAGIDVGLNEIKELKLKGNRCYEEQKYWEAIKHYTEGLQHRMCNLPKVLETKFDIVDLRQALLLNRARSYRKINEPDHALIDSKKCVRISNISKIGFKALLAISVIYKHIGDYTKVLEACDQFLELPDSEMKTSFDLSFKEMRETIIKLTGNNDGYKQEQNENEHEIKQIQKFENKLINLEQSLNKQTMTLSKAQKQCVEYTKQIKQSMETNESLLSINQTLTTQLKETEIARNNLQSMLTENRRENQELNVLKNRYQDECKEITLKYNELKEKYDKQQKQLLLSKNYTEWNHKDIVEWICSLDNGRYNKYKSQISVAIAQENILGAHLMDIDKSDLHRFGITDFENKKRIFNHIQKLKTSNTKNQSVAEGIDETIYH